MRVPAGKLRTRAHVLADLSINHVERQVLRCGFSVERVQHDYGYDLTMTTYHATGEVEPGPVYIQVKATDQLPRISADRLIAWQVSRRDLRLWLNEAYPVLLVVYDGKRDNAYWINIQAHFSTRRTSDLFTGGETMNVHLPVRNRLKPRIIRAIARQKNILHAKLRGK